MKDKTIEIIKLEIEKLEKEIELIKKEINEVKLCIYGLIYDTEPLREMEREKE